MASFLGGFERPAADAFVPRKPEVRMVLVDRREPMIAGAGCQRWGCAFPFLLRETFVGDMNPREALLVAACDLVVFAAMVAGFAALFSPEPKEFVVVSLFLGSCICQVRVALLMARDGVADIVTALIFAIVLAPLLYVMGWLYSREWRCQGLMGVWTGLSVGLIFVIAIF